MSWHDLLTDLLTGVDKLSEGEDSWGRNLAIGCVTFVVILAVAAVFGACILWRF